MLKIVGLQLLLISILMIMGCSDKGSVNKTAGVNLTEPPVLSGLTGVELSPTTPFVSIDDELSFLTSIGDDIVFQKGDKKTIVESGKGGSHRLWLKFDGKFLYAIWWRKFSDGKGKQLFVSASKDKGATFGPVKVISNEYGVLPTVRIASDASGKVMVVYHDERNVKKLQVHANYSSDGGNTWQKHDVRVDKDAILPLTIGDKKSSSLVTTSAEPFVFMLKGGRAVVIWQQVDTLDSIPSLSINAKIYDFNTSQWSDVQRIYYNEEESGVTYSAAQYKNNLLVMVSLAGKGILATLSTDSAQSWQYLGANHKKGSLAKEGHSDWLTAIGAGDYFYIWSSLEKNSPKEIINLSIISLSEKKWLGFPQRFDRGKQDITRSGRQVVTKLADGTIVVAWTDFRHILPTVYMDISRDLGKTWLKTPKPLSTPGYQSMRLVNVIGGADKAWIISSKLDSNGKRLIDTLHYQTVSIGKDGKVSFSFVPVDRVRLSKQEMKKRLEKRVKEFWKLRKEGKWEASWKYFDPLYRLKFGKRNWLATQGQIRFGDFNLTGVEIQSDTFALTSGEVEVGINQQNREGGVLEATPFKKQQAGTRWGWFYDDWYFMPDVFFMKIHDY